MKSKIVIAVLAVFALSGAAAVADLFGMGDVAGFLRTSGDQFKAEYHATQADGVLTETTVITKETAAQ